VLGRDLRRRRRGRSCCGTGPRSSATGPATAAVLNFAWCLMLILLLIESAAPT
jgi:hypothetical protein